MGLLPAAALADVLSFDLVTGVAEADAGMPTSSCNDGSEALNLDVCGLSLFFADIQGSGIDATVTAEDLAGDALFAWYDRSPADFGGMGAAPEANATLTSGMFDGGLDNALNEFVIVTFSETVVIEQFWMNGVETNIGHGPYTGAASLNGINVDCLISVCNNDDVAGTTFAFFADADTQFYLAGVQFSRFVATPEPGIITLLGLGLFGIAFARRKLA